MRTYKSIFKTAEEIATEHAYESQGEDVMIYPCGFAWVYLNVRKNDKLGKALEKEDLMSWNPHYKHYYYWVGDYNQSMLHKEAHAKALASVLTDKFDVEFGHGCRMD